MEFHDEYLGLDPDSMVLTVRWWQQLGVRPPSCWSGGKLALAY